MFVVDIKDLIKHLCFAIDWVTFDNICTVFAWECKLMQVGLYAEILDPYTCLHTFLYVLTYVCVCTGVYMYIYVNSNKMLI